VDGRVEHATRAAGYRAAFSTLSGFNRQDVNRFCIRRLDIFGTDTPRGLLRKVRLGSNDGSLFGQWRYFVTPTPGASNGVSTITLAACCMADNALAPSAQSSSGSTPSNTYA